MVLHKILDKHTKYDLKSVTVSGNQVLNFDVKLYIEGADAYANVNAINDAVTNAIARSSTFALCELKKKVYVPNIETQTLIK